MYKQHTCIRCRPGNAILGNASWHKLHIQRTHTHRRSSYTAPSSWPGRPPPHHPPPGEPSSSPAPPHRSLAPPWGYDCDSDGLSYVGGCGYGSDGLSYEGGSGYGSDGLSYEGGCGCGSCYDGLARSDVLGSHCRGREMGHGCWNMTHSQVSLYVALEGHCMYPPIVVAYSPTVHIGPTSTYFIPLFSEIECYIKTR